VVTWVVASLTHLLLMLKPILMQIPFVMMLMVLVYAMDQQQVQQRDVIVYDANNLLK
jgi:hypothetical protein